MGQHNDKEMRRFFREIERLGFVITATKKGYKITPPSNNANQQPYFTHGTAKAIFPIKRDFRKMYGVVIP